MKGTLALLLTLCLSIPAAFSSDWEEEKPTPAPAPHLHTVPKDTVIIDDANQAPNPAMKTDGSTLLQGSATAIRTKIQPSYTALAAVNAARLAEIQRIDAEANRFLQNAPVNIVTPPSVFRSFIEKNHPEFSLTAEHNVPSNIVIVRGKWDDSSKPLRSLGLKYSSIKTKDLDEFPFDKCKILIIDCAGEIPKATLQKIRDFVSMGGYLLTTDWSLQNVLERSFPEFIRWNRDNTDGVITDAYIVDADSPLLHGVIGRRFTWKLDRLSQCVRVVSPSKVRIIARSSRLAAQDPQLRVQPDPILAGALALQFNFGRGHVLHLVGHFDNCTDSFKPNMLPDPAPGAGISLRQVIATNFIMEALAKKQLNN